MKYRVYKMDDGLFEIYPDAMAELTAAGVELVARPSKDPETIIRNCYDADGLLVYLEPINEAVLQSLPKLRVVARCGVGVDTVDIGAATRRGIQVTNVPDANLHEVATHTIGMALSLTRRLLPFDTSIKGGEWNGLTIGRGMRRPAAQVFGILGFGRIGEQVARIAHALGFAVIVTTPVEAERTRAKAIGAEPVDFDTLLMKSDIVSLHVPLLDSTRGIMDEQALGRMKKGAVLINVSRGGLVDEDALARCLRSGTLSGAGLDVFSSEPVYSKSDIVTAPNVILTPHIAYLSEDSLREVSMKAVRQVISVLEGKSPDYPVNVLER